MVLGGSGLEGRGVSNKNTLAFKACPFFWLFIPRVRNNGESVESGR